MKRSGNLFWFRSLTVAALMACAQRAYAYVDLAPTMGKLLTDSKTVSLVQVKEFDREHRTLTLAEIKTFKGAKPAGDIKEFVAASETALIPRPIVQWAQQGAQAIMFSDPKTAVVCMGEAWYQLKRDGAQWKLGVDRPELPLCYYGSISRLADGIEKMLAGRDAVLTMIPHGVEQGASFELALNNSAFPGLVKVQRLRANMAMPGVVFSVSNNPAYMIGMGPVDEEELPALVAQFKSPDAGVRAEAADDLRQLTEIVGAARTLWAVAALEPLLDDPAPRARMAAAGAMLRITHGHGKALEVLSAGLSSGDGAAKSAAARVAAITGKAGAPLVEKIAALLKEKDERLKVDALQALATLGPVAASARDAVMPLLNDSDFMIDAADTLGHMGPRAQPVPPALVKMLDSDQTAVRWAALRGMSQIGGDESLPAAQYIAKEIGKATEIDAYNMTIYLALIGPPARPIAATIKNIPIINPVLPAATNWAMNSGAALPWQNNGMASFGDVGNFIFRAYVTGLGERLRPAALKLAPALLAGKAGGSGANNRDVPDWGYRILDAAPEESVATIAPHLADADKAMRERAAVILGKMGAPAGDAKAALQKALAEATDEKEKNLLAWAIVEVSRD